MAFNIIKADERRMQQGGIKGVIFGPAKIGKTSLLHTLTPGSTLFMDLEAGGLSVREWEGDSVQIKDWTTARDIACLIGGPNPSMRDDQPYGAAHYDYCVKQYGNPEMFGKYVTIFIDSITVLARQCFQWCQGQPEAFSDKTGKPDTRGAYGLLGRQMIGFVTQMQHIGSRNVWFVGLLDEKRDDFNRVYYEPQIEGSKTGLELPGIVDEVITMAEIRPEEGNPYRAFVCQRPNPWGYPAGDRSGKLDMIEEPHLGRLMDKILNGPRRETLNYVLNGGN